MYSVTYLSQSPDYVIEATGLALDELEALVGRFKAHSRRKGKLRGELRELPCGALEIWKHFPSRKVWRLENVYDSQNK